MKSSTLKFLLIVFIINIICIVICNNSINNVKKVDINLIGEENISINYNTKYDDELFEFKVNGRKVNIKRLNYKTDSNIDSKILGNYYIEYKIKFKNKNYKIKRNVKVIDLEKPTIKTDAKVVTKSMCDKKVVSDLNYTAYDNYDGILTDKVVKEEKDGKLILSVKDSSGNEDILELPIQYVDSGLRYLKLHSTGKVYVKLGDSFIDDGAYISDECGNIIQDGIIGVNNINTDKIGDYKVTYKYNDMSVTRDVTVYNKVSEINNYSYNGKTIYLTFDDGPGMYTERLLSILKKYDVKATFFVTNQFKDYVPLIEKEYKEGHTVAVHTLTHKWSIYQSVDTYLDDFNMMNEIIHDYTGNYSKLFRFPGGSSNRVSVSYSKGIMSALSSRMSNDGYIYFDWNVDSRDAEGKSSADIKNIVINGIKNNKSSVILMHDIKKNTVDVIDQIIQYGINNGYTFKALDDTSPTCHHAISN